MIHAWTQRQHAYKRAAGWTDLSVLYLFKREHLFQRLKVNSYMFCLSVIGSKYFSSPWLTGQCWQTSDPILKILCSVSFIVSVVLCAVFRLIVVLFCVMCVICLLCLIVSHCHRVKTHLQLINITLHYKSCKVQPFYFFFFFCKISTDVWQFMFKSFVELWNIL
jgi:hypothetical protein